MKIGASTLAGIEYDLENVLEFIENLGLDYAELVHQYPAENIDEELLESFNLKYSLLWLCMAAVMLVMVAFPGMVQFIAHKIGVTLPINAIFMAFIFIILLMLVSMTSIVSKQHREIKTLIQNVSLLKKEVEDLNKNNFIPITLGPRILRTEVAPSYCMAAISYELEIEEGHEI